MLDHISDTDLADLLSILPDDKLHAMLLRAEAEADDRVADACNDEIGARLVERASPQCAAP